MGHNDRLEGIFDSCSQLDCSSQIMRIALAILESFAEN